MAAVGPPLTSICVALAPAAYARERHGRCLPPSGVILRTSCGGPFMCGIAGLVGTRPEQTQLSAMAAAMRRRGPDDEGFFLDDCAGLAFRRLAIVDLEGGRQ